MTELTNPAIRVERDVEIPMRDGVVTRGDVYRPDVDHPVPVVMHRTPYDRTQPFLAYLTLDPIRAAAAGIATVVQDVRGRHGSDGEFAPYHQEIVDGYDSVQWSAEQTWSSGRVGMIGASYAGINQLLAAMADPPNLECIIPIFASADLYDGWTYLGGALQWGFMAAWVAPMLASEAPLDPAQIEALRATVDSLADQMTRIEPADLPLPEGTCGFFADWLEHHTRDEYWQQVGIRDHYPSMNVASLHVGGWYDIFAKGTLDNFRAMSARSDVDTRLIMGPWMHTQPVIPTIGTIDMGIGAGEHPTRLGLDLSGYYLDFLSQHLLGTPLSGPSRIEDADQWGESATKVFMLGSEQWRTLDRLPEPEPIALHLHSEGHANTLDGDGTLSPAAPGDEPVDHFIYDPTDPVSTLGGNLCCHPAQLPAGAFDQREIEARHDVLVYATAPLSEPVELLGDVTAEIWLATSTDDTDVTAKLVDVHPCGSRINLADGILRGHSRGGLDASTPIEVDRWLPWTVEVGVTGVVLEPGHQLALEVSSSNSPRFDRNPNSFDGGPPRPAHQRVAHDAEHPSRLIVPVVDGDFERSLS